MIGIFLVNQNIITRDDFFSVSEARDVKTDPIGKIALRERLLTMKQVMDVMVDQATSGGLFGEVAIRSEYLTNQDVWRLIFLQNESRPEFLETAVELGILDESAARNARDLFRKSNAERLSLSKKE